MNTLQFKSFNDGLNELLKYRMKAKQQGVVDFIRLVSVSDSKKCSIVCEYSPMEDNLGLDETSDYYYGLSPKFLVNTIYNAIENDIFNDERKFFDFINDNKIYFSLHENQKKYLDAMTALTILRMAMRFGVRFSIASEDFLNLKSIMEQSGVFFVQGVNYEVFKDEKSDIVNEVGFLGGITEIIAEVLDKFDFGWENNDKRNIIKRKSAQHFNLREFVANRKELNKINNIRLCSGNVYYSGVMPRALKIEKSSSVSNETVEIIKFTVERTTYATLDAFDNCEIMKHPLLKSHLTDIESFFIHEDETQKELYDESDFSNVDEALNSVNRYLEKSYNTNTIAVSGNIVNDEGYLLVAERNYSSIDKNSFYSSVNGQSEFKDYYVPFYKESVNEDYPTLIADIKIRNDFSGELNRETVAELNISNLLTNWSYYGVSILGIKNRIDFEGKRRMHFNILAKNRTEDPFDEILKKHAMATEKFENNRILAFSIAKYGTILERFQSYSLSFLRFINEYSSIISYIVGLAYLIFVGDLATEIRSLSKMDLNTKVTLGLAIVVFINALLDIYSKVSSHIKVKKYIHKFTFKQTNKSHSDFAKWFLKNKFIEKYHPIMYVMLGLYLLDKDE